MTPSCRVCLPVFVILATADLAACVTAPREGVHTPSPVEGATAAVMAAGELAKDAPDEVVLGWKLVVVGDRARFFQCEAEDVCGERPVEVAAKAVVAVKVVGRTRPKRDDGSLVDESDVLRLTIHRATTTSRGGVASDPNRGLTVGGPTK